MSVSPDPLIGLIKIIQASPNKMLIMRILITREFSAEKEKQLSVLHSSMSRNLACKVSSAKLDIVSVH